MTLVPLSLVAISFFTVQFSPMEFRNVNKSLQFSCSSPTQKSIYMIPVLYFYPRLNFLTTVQSKYDVWQYWIEVFISWLYSLLMSQGFKRLITLLKRHKDQCCWLQCISFQGKEGLCSQIALKLAYQYQ